MKLDLLKKNHCMLDIAHGNHQHLVIKYVHEKWRFAPFKDCQHVYFEVMQDLE